MDSEVLAQAFDYVREYQIPIHSLVIVRNGYVVLDAYFYPFEEGQLHDGASMTKSITSTLIGIAIGEHKLSGVRQPVLPLFPQRNIGNRDPQKGLITVEHLLTMTSGLDCQFDHDEITLKQMMQSKNWVQFMLDLPMAAEPGSKFVYCSGGMHLLSGIISQTTGSDALEFARRALFKPLGIENVIWPSIVRASTTAGATFTWLRATWPRSDTCGSIRGAGKGGRSFRRSGCRRQHKPIRIPILAVGSTGTGFGYIRPRIHLNSKHSGAQDSV
jgi:CubicO group peptidase (beta-lactamase class C family)